MKNQHLLIFTLFFALFSLSLLAQNKVGINTNEPTETLDIDGTLRIRDGAQTGHLFQSDSLGKGTWQSPHSIFPSRGIYVTDFGAKGDGLNNDTPNIQAAIDSAAMVGAKVWLPQGVYNIDTTLIVPDGVILIGDGTGSTPTSTPYNGTLLKYTGADWAMQLVGHNSGARDLTVYDTNNSGAVGGGIQVLADGRLVESVLLSNVLISGFTDGVALELNAINGGGIAYSSFYNVRVRHAKTGIHIIEDIPSFTNSNSFYHGAISGGGFDYCLHVQGGNNNIFNGTIMEPFTSEVGHIVVEEGQIIGIGIRIEGTSQPSDKPLLEFKENTEGSYVDGLQSGGLTLDRGDNFINFRTGKSIDYQNLGLNLYTNAALNGTTANTVPYWTIEGTGVQVVALAPEILAEHSVLQFTIPAGVLAVFRPDPAFAPQVMQPYQFDRCNFGAYIKTNQTNLAFTTINAPTGVASSSFHPGDNEWHITGMTGLVNRSQPLLPKFVMDNTAGTQAATVYLTTPTFNFGMSLPQLEAPPLSSAGGVVTGTLSTSMMAVDIPVDGFLVLPHQANVFEINGTQTIQRINHINVDRFAKGTIITLLFNDAGANVVNGAYINLIGAYTSTANSSLTLIAVGNGTWREISRNL